MIVARADHFEIVGTISDIEIIAIGRNIRLLSVLKKAYGPGRWRKLKGNANVRLANGNLKYAEIHWYEAHGIGKVDIKIKRFLEREI